jgi:hypothetical protein
MVENIDQEAARLTFALIELDMNYAREILPDASNDEVLLCSLHKDRYEHVNIPPELRHASRAWLQERGFHRYKQLPWPAEGELPE